MISLRCPLCGSTAARAVDSLTGRELRALWAAFGYTFSPAAWTGIGEDTVVSRFACEDCGFEFFDPQLAGNSAFYTELERPGYYNPARPEFERTLQFFRTRGIKTVLDVGCGDGCFLDMAAASGLQTYGLELNPVAARKAAAKGHRIFGKLLHELHADEAGAFFDLITLFQVLEHVADPAQVLRDAAKWLAPGGFISIAVPGRSALYHRCVSHDPYQWPPHHVSWWRLQDLDRLGQQAGLRTVTKGGDDLLGSRILQAFAARDVSLQALGRLKQPRSLFWVKAAAFLYRKTGMKHIFPKWGSSIYAHYQRA